MVILKISKKGVRNVIIEFDQGQPLLVALDVLVKSNLRKNDEIDEERIHYLMVEQELHEIKHYAFFLLTKRLHSRSELKNKLSKKKFSKTAIESILNQLLENDYIDDSKFAAQFIEEKIKYKKWGKSKLKGELLKRGVDRDIINSVMENSLTESSQTENAFSLAEKKYKLLSNKNIETKKLSAKLFSYLISKGYDYEVSKTAVKDIISTINSEPL